MSFKKMSARWFEPASMALMILGIFALCQPWSKALHQNGVMIIIIGLVGFMVFSHIQPDPEKD